MGGRGNAAARNAEPTYNRYFKNFLDQNGGNMNLAMKSYISDGLPIEYEFGNKTLEIIDDAGMNLTVVKEANPETNYSAEVYVEVYVKEKGTNKKPYWWTIKENWDHKRKKIFDIQVYEGD